MHKTLKEIPDRILQNAVDALSEANHKCVFGPGPASDIWHYDYYCVLDAAHAGELFLKALIAKEHPLLIFKNIFRFNASNEYPDGLTIEKLIQSGETHDFSALPNILWAVCNIKIQDRGNFDFIRKSRNSIQHFVTPDDSEVNGFRRAALKFLHEEIGQLASMHFGIHTIQHIPGIDDYEDLLNALVRHEIKFVFPPDLDISEFDEADIEQTSNGYQKWFELEASKLEDA